jgi:2-dehydro-3-deoxyphosphogluconate aldolase/(4S)-4-hydroxy-2-oxoglutarate aldolase
MRSADTYKLIKDTGIVVIMRGIGEEEALHTAEVLCKAGVKAIEVTFNTPGVDKVILSLLKRFKEEVIVGAGTVTSTASAVRAIECGAEFVLAPNIDPEVVSIVKRYGKLMVPGALTATEVLKCYDSGADIVKIFPVSYLGTKYIKDLRGPYDYIDMMPVGGVDINNAGEFIKAGSIAIGVGGSLIKKDLLTEKNYKAIGELAKKFLDEIGKARY